MIRVVPLEIRQATDPGSSSAGILSGVLVRYGELASDRPERFMPASLRWPASGIVVTEQHQRHRALLRVTPETRAGSVVIEGPLPDTRRARDVAALVGDGVLTGLSVEFRAQRQRYVAGVREILAAQLLRASVVDDPSYGGSQVEVRARRRLWL